MFFNYTRLGVFQVFFVFRLVIFLKNQYLSEPFLLFYTLYYINGNDNVSKDYYDLNKGNFIFLKKIFHIISLVLHKHIFCEPNLFLTLFITNILFFPSAAFLKKYSLISGLFLQADIVIHV